MIVLDQQVYYQGVFGLYLTLDPELLLKQHTPLGKKKTICDTSVFSVKLKQNLY